MRRRIILPCLVLAVLLYGCGKGEGDKTGEVSVPQVQQADQTEQAEEEGKGSGLTEEQSDLLQAEAEPGTVLGEEEVTLMKEGEAQTVPYTRVQGMEGITIAYDPAVFTLKAGEKELRFDAISYGSDSDTPVFLSITETEGNSAETLADQYAAESNEECLTEEVSIGEGEYPAIWVSYAEGTDAKSRTCDLYVFRYNEKLYVVRMDCLVEAYEGMGAEQESILSTLRLDEG